MLTMPRNIKVKRHYRSVAQGYGEHLSCSSCCAKHLNPTERNLCKTLPGTSVKMLQTRALFINLRKKDLEASCLVGLFRITGLWHLEASFKCSSLTSLFYRWGNWVWEGCSAGGRGCLGTSGWAGQGPESSDQHPVGKVWVGTPGSPSRAEMALDHPPSMPPQFPPWQNLQRQWTGAPSPALWTSSLSL